MCARLRRLLDKPDLLVTTPAGYCLRLRPGELDTGVPRFAGHGWAFGQLLLDFLMWGCEPRSGEARSGVDEGSVLVVGG